MAHSSIRYAVVIRPVPSIPWNPEISLNGPSRAMLNPRTIGAKIIAVPVIMSVMLLSFSSSPVMTSARFWNCLPTEDASLPASSPSVIEQRRTSHSTRETSSDIGDNAFSTALSTSPLQMSISLPRADAASAHSGRDPIASTDAFSNIPPLIMAVPISNTQSRRPSSALLRACSFRLSANDRIMVDRAAVIADIVSDSSTLLPSAAIMMNIGTTDNAGSSTRRSVPCPLSRNGLADRSHMQIPTITAGIRTSIISVSTPSSMAIEPNSPPIPITGMIVIITSGARMHRLYTAMHGAVREALYRSPIRRTASKATSDASENTALLSPLSPASEADMHSRIA